MPVVWNVADDERLTAIAALRWCSEQGLYHDANAYYPCAVKPTELPEDDLAEIGMTLAASTTGDDNSIGVFTGEAGVMVAARQRGSASLMARADSPQRAAALVQAFQRLLPEEQIAEDASEVAMTFWYMGNHGPQSFYRRIVVPTYDEIEGNYSPDSRGDLSKLIKRDDWHPESGQLLLWTGVPGTGKTFALRGLASEWRKWCSVHYITDPESFFGRHADYLMSVIFSQEPHASIDDEEDEKPKWKLLVLEDSGELLRADAKEHVGQALSRLLNVVDGLIGQGLQLVVLVTTNEEIKRLHPAVARPGRCAQRIDFESFEPTEAQAWLEERGYEGDSVTRGLTLAELYEKLDEHAMRRDNGKVVGFAAS